MKQNIMDIREWLTLLPINEVEAVSYFSNEYEEYNLFLREDAHKFERLSISRTHLLINTQNERILAYMSLVADSVQLSKSEKEIIELRLIPFSTFPAMKIGKLAVDKDAKAPASYLVFSLHLADYLMGSFLISPHLSAICHFAHSQCSILRLLHQ